ncbi:MAG: response regulator [Proteobacteria bacterium]|nr:response regulator [Pseudomonadota bacterium]MBU4296518.1 response regulator [Pseudomonadota bacterium]MCG2746899.1 response regulator [Desulfobulbaceae bacterium]
MPAIALFSSTFTNESKIASELSSLTASQIISDKDIIADACSKYNVDKNKLEQALYAKMSVFNQFTLEKERCLACLKASLAAMLAAKERCVYVGFITHLISSRISHVLKVLVIDSKEQRVQRAVAAGIPEKDAKRQIHKSDVSAFELTDFLYKKEAWDPTLYDIVIPVDKNHTIESILKFILENFHKSAVQKSEGSVQALKDMALAAQVELALLGKGHNIEVAADNGQIRLTAHKSVLNFGKLESELSEIASAVRGVKGVEVLRGPDYKTSIYRKQEFELPSKVLLVDDEKEFAQTLSERLISRDVGSHAVYDGQQALDLLNNDNPDVMVLDLKMPGIDGIEVLRQTRKTHPNIKVIILTGHGTAADRKVCMDLGAFAYLQKPTDIEKLSATIYDAYKKIEKSGTMAFAGGASSRNGRYG